MDPLWAELVNSDWHDYLAQGRDVEYVLQTLSRCFEQNRERRVLGRDGEQIRRSLPLLPQRCSFVGTATRQQQSPSGALSESRREQCGLRQCGHDEFVDVIGIDQQCIERQLVGRLGEPQHDAIVAPHRLDRNVVLVDESTFDRHRPRRDHR